MVDDKTHRTFPSHQFENQKKSFDTKIEEMKTSTNQMHKKRETRNVIYSQKKKENVSVQIQREREAGKRRRRVKFIAAGILMK
jgi:hypothetical protein